MKPSPKFNHRRKFEREMPAPRVDIVTHVPFMTGAVDEDFEDFGEKQDYVVAPDLTVHHYHVADNGAQHVVIERVSHAPVD
jgi:hypothetical protein